MANKTLLKILVGAISIPLLYLFFKDIFVESTPSATVSLPKSTEPTSRLSGPIPHGPTTLPTYISDDEEDEDDEVAENSSIITGLNFPTPTPTITKIPLTHTEESTFNDIYTEAARVTREDSTPGPSRSHRSSPPLSAIIGPEQPPPTPTENPTANLTKVNGQPRGYQMLYLMHPKARATVEKQVEILLRSNVLPLYLATIVDGTFGLDFEYLNSVIQRLNGDGRSLTLVLYMSSGPTMRRYSQTKIDTPFSHIEPSEFRGLIFWDETVRNAFEGIVQRARTAFELNHSLNVENENIAIPMLEDNLQRESYQEMKKLLVKNLGGAATIMRNPCPSCFPGNDTESFGDSIELHGSKNFAMLDRGDAYVLDGEDVSYPGEDSVGKLTVEQLRNLLNQSIAKGQRYFGLWRKDRQGLGDQLTHPDDRNYAVPSEEIADLEVSLLREGLIPIEETADEEDEGLRSVPSGG